MQAAAATFVAALLPQEDAATVVTLSGDLGAGKTTFVQGVASALGVTGQVTSPTFTLMHIYELVRQRWQRLVHIDAYRLEDARALAPLGWGDILADAGALVLLEWPEQVAGAIPSGAVALRIEDAGGTARRIITSYGG